ncbi:MAG: hypothetical protein GXP53_01005 [Deltaproteobacteria bacterium]|nr:hypothetical protein [Deltaproteobacteria bacterium]
MISFLYVAWITMHLVFAFVYRVGSDESQHLHVIWGWANGLVQYRDVFDNHTPLFHLLCVPLYKMFGEQPFLLLDMRLAMIPLIMVTIAATYVIGRKLYNPRAALQAALVTGFMPGFFLKSVEFRTDDLWMTTWLLSLMFLFTGRMTKKRAWFSGLLLGMTLAVSMKTILLLAALGAAYLTANFMAGKRLRKFKVFFINFLSGFIIIPGACVILFMLIPGGFGPFIYGVIGHNMVVGLGHWRLPIGFLFFPLSLPLIFWGAKRFTDISSSNSAINRLILYFCLCFYLSALWSFWPLITPQDYLPVYPLLALTAIPPLVKKWGEKSDRLFRPITAGRFSNDFLILLIIVVLEIATISLRGEPWKNNLKKETKFLAETLELTRPGESIMDLKGETIFRPRPFYYALESITRARLEKGLIADTIVRDIIAAHTMVVALDSNRFTPSARHFLNDHYLKVGRLRVAGQWLSYDKKEPGKENGGFSYPFEIINSAKYSIVSENGRPEGTIDGLPYAGPRFLKKGHHVFVSPRACGCRMAVIWKQAASRGFSPFKPS